MIEDLMEKDFHKVNHLFEERPFIEGLRSTLGSRRNEYVLELGLQVRAYLNFAVIFCENWMER